MSIVFDRFCGNVSFNIPTAHLLLNCIGIGPCEWPSAFSVLRSSHASLALKKPIPVSDSWADDMTPLITLELIKMGPLSGGGGSSGLIGSLGCLDR